jgi:hypothetical protein
MYKQNFIVDSDDLLTIVPISRLINVSAFSIERFLFPRLLPNDKYDSVITEFLFFEKSDAADLNI